MQSALPDARIAPLLRERFVLLSADADDAEPEVDDLAAKLEDATMLPFVMITDARGRFLGGMWGLISVPQLLRRLNEILAAQAE